MTETERIEKRAGRSTAETGTGTVKEIEEVVVREIGEEVSHETDESAEVAVGRETEDTVEVAIEAFRP